MANENKQAFISKPCVVDGVRTTVYLTNDFYGKCPLWSTDKKKACIFGYNFALFMMKHSKATECMWMLNEV